MRLGPGVQGVPAASQHHAGAHGPPSPQRAPPAPVGSCWPPPSPPPPSPPLSPGRRGPPRGPGLTWKAISPSNRGLVSHLGHHGCEGSRRWAVPTRSQGGTGGGVPACPPQSRGGPGPAGSSWGQALPQGASNCRQRRGSERRGRPVRGALPACPPGLCSPPTGPGTRVPSVMGVGGQGSSGEGAQVTGDPTLGLAPSLPRGQASPTCTFPPPCHLCCWAEPSLGYRRGWGLGGTGAPSHS